MTILRIESPINAPTTAIVVAAPYCPAGPILIGTSSSSVTIPDDYQLPQLIDFVVKEFNVGFQVGTRMRAAVAGSPNLWMEGIVHAFDYNTNTLTLRIPPRVEGGRLSGSGTTREDWTLNITGEPGERGERGDVGTRGPTGPAGGPTGPPGASGPAGVRGTTILGQFDTLDQLQAAHQFGLPGDAYLVGSYIYAWQDGSWVQVGNILGPQGATGPTGPATIAAGTLTIGTPPSVTNSGTNTDAVFDFILPPVVSTPGPQGIPGPAGPPGPTGSTGATGGPISSVAPPLSIDGSGQLSLTGGPYAPLASPTFSGTPTAPNPAAANDSQQIATTSWARGALIQKGGAGTSANAVLLGWTGSNLQATVDTTNLGNLWYSSNFNPATKVDVSGDTMTGNLTVNGIVQTSNRFQSTSGRGLGITNYETIAGPQYVCPISTCNPNFGASDMVFSGIHVSGTWAGFRFQVDTFEWQFRNTGEAHKAVAGGWIAISDVRIKNVLGDYTHGLDEIRRLRPINFTFRGNDTEVPPNQVRTAPYRESMHYQLANDGKQVIGLVAQEVETVLPELVTRQNGFIDGKQVDDMRHFDPSALVFTLINAVKTLADRVEALEAARR